MHTKHDQETVEEGFRPTVFSGKKSILYQAHHIVSDSRALVTSRLVASVS